VSSALNAYVSFPHVEQVFCIERIVTKLDGSPLRGKRPRVERMFGVTSLAPVLALPARLLELNRGHWSIENRVHYVRDWTFDEDRCRVRKGHAAQTLAALRNLAISLMRQALVSNVAASVRRHARRVGRALALIGV
jgi:hypothetical protein